MWGEMLQGNHVQLMSNTQTELGSVRIDTHFGWNPINGGFACKVALFCNSYLCIVLGENLHR